MLDRLKFLFKISKTFSRNKYGYFDVGVLLSFVVIIDTKLILMTYQVNIASYKISDFLQTSDWETIYRNSDSSTVFNNTTGFENM